MTTFSAMWTDFRRWVRRLIDECRQQCVGRPQEADEVVARHALLRDNERYMREDLGIPDYTTPKFVIDKILEIEQQHKDLYAVLLAVPALKHGKVMHVSPCVWHKVQEALFQDKVVPIADVPPSAEDKVRELLRTPPGLRICGTDAAGVWQYERDSYPFEERNLHGQSAKGMPQFEHGSVVTCYGCGSTLAGRKGELPPEVAATGFNHDPSSGEAYCQACTNGNTGGCTLIQDADGVMAIYGDVFHSHGYDTYVGSLSCQRCHKSLCDENGCVSEPIYESKTDPDKLWCERCFTCWSNSMPAFCIRVRLVPGGESKTISVYRKPIAFATAVRCIVIMQQWRARALKTLYAPSSGKGARLAKASYEAAQGSIC